MKQSGPPPPLSNNPPISEHFFHNPPLYPNFKNKNPPPPNFRGAEETMITEKGVMHIIKPNFR